MFTNARPRRGIAGGAAVGRLLAVGVCLLVVACSQDPIPIEINDPEETSQSPAPTTTSAPQAGFVISSPQPGSTVGPDGIPVSGRSGLEVTDSLWTVYRGITNGNISFQPSGRPCAISTDGSFNCPQQFVGGDSDGGERFEVLFLKADAAAVEEFRAYAASNPAARNYPGLDRLPVGVEQLGSVVVTRS